MRHARVFKLPKVSGYLTLELSNKTREQGQVTRPGRFKKKKRKTQKKGKKAQKMVDKHAQSNRSCIAMHVMMLCCRPK